MLSRLVLWLMEVVSGFFVFLLLIRFHMQWLRAGFHNPLGQFVLAVTNWLVQPLRRLLPGLFGLDLASLVGAWLLQGLYLCLLFWLSHFSFGSNPALAGLLIAAIAAIELVRFSIYILVAVVLFAVILSWVNPHAPLAPLFNSLTRPFLRPFQRLIPPIAQIDLSPLILLVLLQGILILLGGLRSLLIPWIA